MSDNFDSPTLNANVWAAVNPIGDGTVTMSGTSAFLNVPNTEAHDLWTFGNNTVSLQQPVENSNFTVEVKFESAVQFGNQDEGIVVVQDANDFLRFDFLNDGTNVNFFAAGISGTSGTAFARTPIVAPNAPLWLRVARSGDNWVGSWSVDGVNFTIGCNFTYALHMAHIGPYAGNGPSSTGVPSFTAIVDYFFNTASPLANQSGPAPYPMVVIDPNPPGVLVAKTLANIQGVASQLNPVVGFEFPYFGIYWYEYPTSRNLNDTWIRHTIVSGGSAYEDMIPHDVNGDGAVDIVASYTPAGSTAQYVVWFENPLGSGGNPATDTWVMHTIGPAYGESNLAMADIDGDGKMDFVTPSFIYFQNSPTSWTTVQYNTAFLGVALLDIGSGNGAINLVGIGSSPSFNIVWFENPRETGGNARTGTWIPRFIAAGVPCPGCTFEAGDVYAFNAADFNGDGRMDVVSGDAEGNVGGGLIWYEAPVDRRNGAWIPHTIDSSFVTTQKIKVDDMDQNGTMDLVTAEQDQSPLRRVAVFYNDGAGNFNKFVLSNNEGNNIVLGDVVGNGNADILDSGHGYDSPAFHPLVLFMNPLHTIGTAIPVVVNSNAPGATFTVAGTGCSPGTRFTPADINWTAGEACTVTINAPIGFTFSNWSDGITANPRTFIAPTYSAFLNAELTERPQAGCSYTLSAMRQDFSSPLSTGQFTVTAPAGCQWTATANDPWLTVLTGASGSGTGVVSYQVDANDQAYRLGSMTVAGASFTVAQTGFRSVDSQVTYPMVFRPSNGTWYSLFMYNGAVPAVQWGAPGDIPVVGDYDGDGINDYAVFRPSTGLWYVLPSSNPGAPIVVGWGASGDVPVPADYDGDGKTDFAVWRPSTGVWYIIPSSHPASPIVTKWGAPGDTPVVADYDGDGKADLAVFRPSTSVWYVIPTSHPGSPIVTTWGSPGDTPVPADYDGDGRADIAIWRPSTGVWYIIPSSHPAQQTIQQWGSEGDIPVPGDFDGNGISDIAVWRPSTGDWFIIFNGSGAATVQPWGAAGDIPLTKTPE